MTNHLILISAEPDFFFSKAKIFIEKCSHNFFLINLTEIKQKYIASLKVKWSFPNWMTGDKIVVMVNKTIFKNSRNL
jgi:hypothetical protein